MTDRGAVRAAIVTDVATARLRLHPVGVAEAERVVGGVPGRGDAWAADFPHDGDVLAMTAFVEASRLFGDPGPLGQYLVVRRSDGLAVGGIGFKGPAHDGAAEVGYGIVPSARGHGFAAEALAALLGVGRVAGLRRVVAEVLAVNVASRRALERAGFRVRRTDDGHLWFEVDLDAPERPGPAEPSEASEQSGPSGPPS